MRLQIAATLMLLACSCDKPASPATPPSSDAPSDVFAGAFEFDVAGVSGPIPPLEPALEESLQRSMKLGLVTLDLQGTVDDLEREIFQQCGVAFKRGDVDRQRKVSVTARDWPVIRVLNHVGLDCDENGMLRDYRAGPATSYTEGLRLSFSARRWEPEGRLEGWIIETQGRADAQGLGLQPSHLTWNVASIATKRAHDFEWCDLHSPRLVFVRDPELKDIRVTIRGKRTWFLDIPIEFKNPKDDDVWRGRGFEVSLKWPFVVVTSSRPYPLHLLRVCLSRSDIACYLPDGREGALVDTLGVGGGGGGGGRYGGRFGKKVDWAWCGCQNAPTKQKSTPEPSGDMHKVELFGTGPFSRFRTIQIKFRALVEEDFEVTSDPVK